MPDIYRVKNNSGAAIPRGRVVYVSGSSGSHLTVKLARANSTTTMPAFGLTDESIADGALGRVIHNGEIINVDTSAWLEGQTLFVSPTAAGAMTTAEPAFPDLAQTIGVVRAVGISNGVIEVLPGVISNLVMGENDARLALIFEPAESQVSALGLSTIGNTGGQTRVMEGQFVLVGSQNITLSQATSSDNAGSSATISIYGASGGGGGVFSGGISTLGNTAGTTGLVQS
ncbi:MAG: hypothetical protein ACRDH5_12910, partial [bacterium]